MFSGFSNYGISTHIMFLSFLGASICYFNVQLTTGEATPRTFGMKEMLVNKLKQTRPPYISKKHPWYGPKYVQPLH